MCARSTPLTGSPAGWPGLVQGQRLRPAAEVTRRGARDSVATYSSRTYHPARYATFISMSPLSTFHPASGNTSANR